MAIEPLIKKLERQSKQKTILILGFITVLSHASYIFNGFTWLDHIDIENRQAIHAPQEFLTTFTKPYSATNFYRPMISIFHSIDFAIYRDNAAGYHVTNIVLHLGVVLCTFYIIHRLIGSTSISLIASIVVAIHPVTALSIGSISYRTDLLATLFILLATVTYIGYIQKQQFRYSIASSIFFFFALCSKETAIIWFPAILVALAIHFKLRTNQRHLLTLLTYSIVSLAYYLLRNSALSSFWQFSQVPLSWNQYLGTRLANFTDIFLYVIRPAPAIPISDAVPILSIQSPKSLIGLILLAICIYVLYRIKKYQPVFLAAVLLIITFLPSFNIVPLPRFISPHYLYFSIVIIALILAIIIKHLSDHQPKIVKYVILTIIGWYSIASITTFIEGFSFKNDQTLFEHEAINDQQFKEGRLYLAAHHLQNTEYAKAISQYQAILADNPNSIAFADTTAARINLAYAYLQTKQVDQAEQILKDAIQSAPAASQPQIAYNLSLIYVTKGDFSPTIPLLEPHQQNLPPSATFILVEAYLATGQQEKAKQTLESIRIYKNHPTYQDHYQKLESQLQDSTI